MTVGRLLGPVLGPEAVEGPGSLVVTPEGLAWEFRRGFRKRSGVVSWDRIVKWEAGLQQLGRDSAWVAFVSYGPEKGFLGLHCSGTQQGSDEIRVLTAAASEHLPAGVVDAQW